VPWLLLFYSLSNGLGDPFNEGAIQPFTLSPGAIQVSAIDGVRLGLDGGRELITGGVSSLVSPELMLTQQVVEDGSFALAVSGGAGFPTPGLRLAQGLWFPGDVEIPPAIVGAGGLSVALSSQAYTVAAAVHARKALVGGGVLSVMDHAWLDPYLAPLTEGWAVSTRLRLSWLPLSGGWEVLADGVAQWPAGPDLNGRLLAYRGVSEHWALGLGGAGAMESHTYGVDGHLAPLLDFKGQF